MKEYGKEEFEVWYSSLPNPSPLTKSGEDDRYNWGPTYSAWIGWKAAVIEMSSRWRPIETAPEYIAVLVCGGDCRGRVCIAMNDPTRFSPAPNAMQSWYEQVSRGTGSIWPAPTHWMPLPSPPETP
jgi:hypothetical protein